MPTKEEQDAYEARAAETRSTRPRSGVKSARESGVRVKKQESSTLGRIGLIISGFLFAGMVLFTLSGYERISRAYADINALNTEIEETKLSINALEAAIECAVTIDQAQQ